MVDWQKIDVVLLDMDGTLLDLHYDNYFWLQHLPMRYAQIFDQPEQEVRERLYAMMVAKRGSLEWYCTDHWSQTLEVNIPELKAEITHKIGWRPGALAFLDWLKVNQKTTLLATNAHRDVVDIKMQQCDMSHHLQGIVSSHDYGAAKEEQSFWQQLCEQQNIDPSTALFIDDSEAVLNSAQQFGIGHLITITRPDSQKPGRENLNYAATDDFSELICTP